METVGEILKKNREKKKKSLQQVERSTKIPQKTLKSLESNNFSTLPSLPYIKGFIRIYSQYLELDPDKLVAIFRRDWKKVEEKSFIPSGFFRNFSSKFWSPHTAKILLVFLLSSIFFVYIGIQLNNFFSTPKLKLSEPESGIVIDEKQVVVKGNTEPENSVYINDQLINVQEDGSFTYTLKLFPGENDILIRAVNRHNKVQTIKRTVEVVDNN